MLQITLLTTLLASAAALQPRPVCSRRRALAKACASMALPVLPSLAGADFMPPKQEGGAFAAACFGFGCSSYGATDFDGLKKEDAPVGAMPYQEFLAAVKDKKVEGVVFQPPSGDEAYAIIGGKSLRIGEGWPVEISNSWSSPTWVVRILQNEGVPYAFNYDLTTKSKTTNKASYTPKTYKYEPYMPPAPKRPPAQAYESIDYAALAKRSS